VPAQQPVVPSPEPPLTMSPRRASSARTGEAGRNLVGTAAAVPSTRAVPCLFRLKAGVLPCETSKLGALPAWNGMTIVVVCATHVNGGLAGPHSRTVVPEAARGSGRPRPQRGTCRPERGDQNTEIVRNRV